jgi:uncharacterized membrane protein YdjX (TVP38/TMEM64 family)
VAQDSSRGRRRKLAKWTLLAVGVAALILLSRSLPLGAWLASFQTWVEGLGFAGMALYALLYAVVTVLLGPAWLLTLGAGFSFGLLRGVLVVWAGATVGAALAFLIARHLARARVEKWTGRDHRFRAIDRAIAKKGWKIVALLRLSPLVPFAISNYIYGLTGIRFWPYVLASALGMLPLVVLYTSFGVAGREAALAASGGGAGGRSVLEWFVLGVGLFVTVVGAFLITRAARKELAKAKLEERDAAR